MRLLVKAPMSNSLTSFDALAAAQNVLGYLNFSDGRPNAKFQKALDSICTELVRTGELYFWRGLPSWLEQQGESLRKGDRRRSKIFRKRLRWQSWRLGLC